MPPQEVEIPKKWPIEIPRRMVTMAGARIREGVQFTIIPKETIELEGDFFLRLHAYYPSFRIDTDSGADTGLETNLSSLLSPLLNIDKLGLSRRYKIKFGDQEEINRRMAQVTFWELERCALVFHSSMEKPFRMLNLVQVSILTCGRWLNGVIMSGHDVTLDRFFDVSQSASK
jgi:hypothetical protein